MPAGRFVLLEVALTTGAEIELPAEIAHQARDVLRLGTGATLRLLDGHGGEYPAEVVAVDRKRVIVRLGAREEVDVELPVRVTLCQGMLKAAKFEWVLQKGTELGVSAFVPMLCERAVAVHEASGEARRERWARILAEAMEQCGGARLPDLSAPRPLADLLADCPAGTIMLFPWEEEHEMPLRPALLAAIHTLGGIERTSEVRIFIGPEGGFSSAEAALARRHEAIPVTLGHRILRAETAAIVAAALVVDAVTELAAQRRNP